MASVRFWHFRLSDGKGTYATKGGVTVAAIALDAGREAFGVSICSLKDTFAKPRGRAIAQGRAFAAMAARSACWGHITAPDMFTPSAVAVHAAQAIYRKRFHGFYRRPTGFCKHA